MALRSNFTAGGTAFKFATVATAAIMLQACSTVQSAKSTAGLGTGQYRDAIGVHSSTKAAEGMDPIAAAAFWGTRYNTDQNDTEAAVNFSKALRKIGSLDEAVKVMGKLQGQASEDADISLEYGKVLVENGRAFEAVRHLENAVAQKPGDWTALSAYGVALDQIGEHEEARKQYDRALGVFPNNISVLNNKGLSYALDGKLSIAERTLRVASGGAGSDSRVRQNLALVLAIGGDLNEAERLARSDLPPRVADNNIAFYKQLLNQPAYWGEYASVETDIPTFDEPDATLQSIKSDPIPLPPKPTLKEQNEPETDDGAPIALGEVAPVTQASAVVAAPTPVVQATPVVLIEAEPVVEITENKASDDADEILELPSLKNDSE